MCEQSRLKEEFGLSFFLLSLLLHSPLSSSQFCPPSINLPSVPLIMDHITHLFTSGPSALWSTLQDTPPSIVVPLITITAALPIVLFSLYHAYAVSPVILIHNKSPVSITTYDSKTDTTKREDLVEYIKKKCPSLFGPGAVFRPTPWLANGHLQTACSAMKEFQDLYRIDYHR